MKRKIISAFLFGFIALFVFGELGEAAVKVTVKNNRSHTVSLAFCWAGFDMGDDVSKGWYNVKAGETRIITLKDANAAFTSQDFGYYAKGTPKGGKTIYWSGKASQERPQRYWIHPGKGFTFGHWGTMDADSNNPPIEGAQKVIFRSLKIKKAGDTDATATLTFNP